MSFDDSCNFDVDSWSQYTSEQEPCNTWRGWKNVSDVQSTNREKFGVSSLVELAAKQVAKHIPFEFVEKVYPPVPEQLQLRIAFWSFPENEEDIRLYSCLANGSGDEFYKGETLFKMKIINEALQIGFHLSTNVKSLSDKFQSSNVSLLFDRCKITSCTCMCGSPSSWCSHVVALCLLRIHKPHLVKYRAPVSESLSRLQRDQLQKFAQYLISELPQQVLPTAQKILDELLLVGDSKINRLSGAPDPTAGGSALELTQWCLDKSLLHENIKKTLYKLCLPSPIVFSDVNYLSSSAPPAALEWSNLLRPLRGREPEGLWNLLNIVCEIFKRRDRSAIDILQIITHECLSYDQILLYWYNTKVAEFHCKNILNRNSGNGITVSTQHACLNLCEEIVSLWCICVLNPELSLGERKKLKEYLVERHTALMGKIMSAAGRKITQVSSTAQANYNPLHPMAATDLLALGQANGVGYCMRTGTANTLKKFDLETFPGFKPAIEACAMPLPDTKDPYQQRSLKIRLGEVVKVLQDINKPSVHVMENDTLETLINTDTSLGGTCFNHNLIASASEYELPGIASQSCSALSLHHDITYSSFNPSRYSQELLYANLDSTKATSVAEPNILANIRNDFDLQEVLYHQTRGLYYHGYRSSSSMHATTLARLMLSTVPDFLPPAQPTSTFQSEAAGKDAQPTSPVIDYASTKKKPKKNYKAVYTLTQKALQGLTQTIFVTTVLCDGHTCPAPRFDQNKPNDNSSATFESCSRGSECPSLLALKLGLSRLKVLRPPASSKALEVKTSNQESQLANLLITIPIDESKYELILEEAYNFINTVSKKIDSTTSCLLPYTLATLLFETLSSSRARLNQHPNRVVSNQPKLVDKMSFRYKTTEESPDLGLEVGLAALEMCHNISETEFPLLIEGMRRQRGDLALLLLLTYKDDVHKLAQVMDKFLDVSLHWMCQRPLPFYYYTNAELPTPHHIKTSLAASVLRGAPRVRMSYNEQALIDNLRYVPPSVRDASFSAYKFPEDDEGCLDADNPSTSGLLPLTTTIEPRPNIGEEDEKFVLRIDHKIKVKSLSHEMDEEIVSEYSLSSGESSTANFSLLSSSGTTLSEQQNKHGTAIPDPKIVAIKDTLPSNVAGKLQCRRTSAPGYLDATIIASVQTLELGSTTNKEELDITLKPSFKGDGIDDGENSKRDITHSPLQHCGPSVIVCSTESTLKPAINALNGNNLGILPTHQVARKHNVPSEAGAHYMFEFAKNLLIKAGGNSNSDLFLHTTPHLLRDDPHHALQFCAFQIGVYALGLHNRVSPNWYSRTYSSHVSWITSQALEIGALAILFLIDTWYTHLTPSEGASLADKASNICDSTMPYISAELALSCLNHCQSLSIIETQKALIQCKEQNNHMLEKACDAVERVAKITTVSPEVLFEVSRHWYWLYQISVSPPYDIKQGAAILDPKNAIGNGHWVSYAEQLTTQPSAGMSWHFQPTTLSSRSYSDKIVQNPFQSPYIMISPSGKTAAAASNAFQQNLRPLAQQSNSTTTFNNTYNNNNGNGLMSHYHPPPSNNVDPAYFNPNSAPPPLGLFSLPPPPPWLHHLPPPPPPIQAGPYTNLPGFYPHAPPFYPSGGPNLIAGGEMDNIAIQHGQTMPVPALAYPNINNTNNFHYHYYYYYHNTVNNANSSSHVPAHNNFAGTVYRGSLSNPFNYLPKTLNSDEHTHGTEKKSHAPNELHNVATSSPLKPDGGTDGPKKSQGTPTIFENKQALYLASTFRVGLMAVEALGKKIHDERPQSKYAPNPPYGEDIKWLLRISMQIGPQAFHRFCNLVLTCIMSPFILQEVLLEATNYITYYHQSTVQGKDMLLDHPAAPFSNANSFAPLPPPPFSLPRNHFHNFSQPQMGINLNLFQHCISSTNPSVISNNAIDSSILITLRAKCCQMYSHWATMKLAHLTIDDYDDFVQSLSHAKWAFLLSPDGSSLFNDFLQNLRRSKSLKKDLWQKIIQSVQNY